MRNSYFVVAIVVINIVFGSLESCEGKIHFLKKTPQIEKIKTLRNSNRKNRKTGIKLECFGWLQLTMHGWIQIYSISLFITVV